DYYGSSYASTYTLF
nr:immunoglobulin light chain junction region [Macaca mulatta]